MNKHSRSNPNPASVWREKTISAARAVNPFNPAWVSRMPGKRVSCANRLKSRLIKCRV